MALAEGEDPIVLQDRARRFVTWIDGIERQRIASTNPPGGAPVSRSAMRERLLAPYAAIPQDKGPRVRSRDNAPSELARLQELGSVGLLESDRVLELFTDIFSQSSEANAQVDLLDEDLRRLALARGLLDTDVEQAEYLVEEIRDPDLRHDGYFRVANHGSRRVDDRAALAFLAGPYYGPRLWFVLGEEMWAADREAGRLYLDRAMLSDDWFSAGLAQSSTFARVVGEVLATPPSDSS
jgi:hypothetical protein